MKKSELSNDLLISLSMGFEKEESTNQAELTAHLTSNNILRSAAVRKAFLDLDRDIFAINKKQKIYGNNPLSIGGGGQNMTSPLMHGIVLEELYEQLTELLASTSSSDLTLLDVGCGRGFVVFALANIIN